MAKNKPNPIDLAPIDLLEAVNFDTGAVRIDEEKGIAYDLKVLGVKSSNGFAYPEATRKAAHKLLEGQKINLNHVDKKNPGADVLVEQRFGILRNVHESETGTRADIHYLTKHAFAPTFVEGCKRMPEAFGFSIRGNGFGSKKDAQGNVIVESISRLRSVDLVADAATCRSLTESEDRRMDLVEAETEAEEGGRKAHELLAECMGACAKEGMHDYIPHLSKLHKKMTGAKEEEAAAGDETREGVDQDKVKAEQEAAAAKLKVKCIDLCESLQMTPDSTLIDTLSKLPCDEDRVGHLKYLKRTRVVQKPKSGSTESTLGLQESKLEMTEEARLARFGQILRG